MATKESEVASNEHPTSHQTDGTNGHDLGRQISVTLTPQQFEELYLQPSIKSRNQMSLVKTFGNPTSFGIVSFLLTLTPTSCCLMGWRGASSNSLLALIGAYYFMGGMAMIISGLLEWVVGNTFPFLVFASFGTFWMTLAGYLDPRNQVQASLLKAAQGGGPATYYVPFGYYLVFWAVYTYFLTFAAFRTNVVLVWILLFVALTFTTLGAAYFKFGEDAVATGGDLVIAAGACGFTACMGGFYILLHLCLAATDFPFNIPLFDLAHLWGSKQ
ncbi:related to ATO3-plasma membrane protein with possible role in export of ammonia [Sporisorium scitamineum]|uniref:Related to ATO3-plasma membrane protein with possible role in export of ammonia n=1 Tax=Sporisorium scitamineum TaxID=49012 RepID=A0A0F7RX22_9BASI|nr:related to ATO3-plasma membrane protein with possible role in export of ammonia [Sporisorium scitamineum]CDS00980.1 hypothetical protein [Sporisorium scitamineum]